MRGRPGTAIKMVVPHVMAGDSLLWVLSPLRGADGNPTPLPGLQQLLSGAAALKPVSALLVMWKKTPLLPGFTVCECSMHASDFRSLQNASQGAKAVPCDCGDTTVDVTSQ